MLSEEGNGIEDLASEQYEDGEEGDGQQECYGYMMLAIQNSTLHYKIVLSFNDGQYFEILEGKSEYKIKGQFVQIARYINYAYQDLQIVDETFQVR
ncbi:unnamed protein product (macronuclear) [Paramecium tetraurelia]|uniref:Uncharacterized protein n=1 Tax=Paramecium tetraurelia TaxID=5888 RepID=A0CCM9_PARTE|nr:uncharacterized protein GSPATT00037331001 [Paramecium tetraurelia]CAK68546.1 unnamed protein product [Paramecium tetraurelia]|eukprot:XP_001435943.1 hypothetical protein (macronuclear) [Paramecium tetraurelia strain d4-2]